MTKLIVDSNIIFSALLNVNSKIGQILLTGNDVYDFYAPRYLRDEIWKHKERIMKIGNLDDGEFIEVYELILKNITVLNHSLVPNAKYKKAFDFCYDIDPNDTVFIAFSLYLNCKIWTGDKKLVKGLAKKRFKKVITTEEIFKDFLKKKIKR